jgi:Bacterial Ig-like domain
MRKFLYSHIPPSLLLVFLATILWTCNGGGGGGGGGTPDNTAPTVSSTFPADMADNVSIVTAISVTFSEQMDASTVDNTSFTVADGGGPVAGTVSYSGTTATFTPTNPLDLSTTYTATVSTGVTDMAGNALALDYNWTFTTAATFTGFTPDLVMGMAFAQINEQPTTFDDWVIQFDTTTFGYWESEGTYDPVTGDGTITGRTSGTGTWSISSGELLLDLPGQFNVAVSLLDNTATYIDVQADDGSNPPENARLYKTNPFVDADVSGQTFDYGNGYTETFLADHTGTGNDNSAFTWAVDANGVLVETFSDGWAYYGYRLVNTDPNIVWVEFDDTGTFNDVYPETYTVL